MALAWECKIKFVCLSLAPNEWDLRALSQLNALSILQHFVLKLFLYLPSNLQGILQFMPFIYE